MAHIGLVIEHVRIVELPLETGILNSAFSVTRSDGTKTVYVYEFD
jgi:hypothetical protein